MTVEQWADRLVLEVWLAWMQAVGSDAYQEQRRVTLTPPNGLALDAAVSVLTEFRSAQEKQPMTKMIFSLKFQDEHGEGSSQELTLDKVDDLTRVSIEEDIAALLKGWRDAAKAKARK